MFSKVVAKIIKSASVFRALCDGGWSLFQNPRFQNDDLEKGWKLGWRRRGRMRRKMGKGW